MQIANLEVRNTARLIDENTRTCGLVWAPPKFGKTTFGATLDKLTKKYFSKPTLFIACEAGEGGGTASIQEFGVDYVTPSSKEELQGIIAALQTDRTYGGIFLDSSTETVKRLLQPAALKFPTREKMATRSVGVPERSDYQTMGEMLRVLLNDLIGLTTLKDVNLRKHVWVTALERTREDRDGNIISIGPDLPGAMSTTATAMFQTVANIQIKQRLERETKKLYTERLLVTEADGKRIVGDRFKVFPSEGPCDLEMIWEQHWLPRLKK